MSHWRVYSGRDEKLRDRAEVAESFGIRHGPDALDLAVGDVERPHGQHAITAIEELGARLAVDLDSLDPRTRSPEL